MDAGSWEVSVIRVNTLGREKLSGKIVIVTLYRCRNDDSSKAYGEMFSSVSLIPPWNFPYSLGFNEKYSDFIGRNFWRKARGSPQSQGCITPFLFFCTFSTWYLWSSIVYAAIECFWSNLPQDPKNSSLVDFASYDLWLKFECQHRKWGV